MACALCEHCNGPMTADDDVTFREGYSYHQKCHKCYVCSETDLHDAEIFKGVIFCSSCSQRIFQGCSTARRTKTNNPKRRRSRSHRRDRTWDRRAQQKRQNGVIASAGLNLSTDSDSRSNSDGVQRSRLSKTLVISTELALQVGKEIYEESTKDLKKNSTEMGMTTEVTQELLKQIHCPVVTQYEKPKTASGARTRIKHNVDKRSSQHKYINDNKNNCSDLRVAELGASTEIANMALRKKSELPVILKTDSGCKHIESTSQSNLNQETDVSGDGQDRSQRLDSAYSSLDESEVTPRIDRNIRSLLRTPYKCFKKNILTRSSLVSVLMDEGHSRFALLKKFKMLFYEEITDHHRRGIKRLYSTINRRKTPYKLGWLQLVSNAAKVSPTYCTTQVFASVSTLSAIFRPRLCKHFKASHSYRCMRAHVMRLAGPTRSELACFRRTLKRLVAPHFFRHIANIYNRRFAAITMSQGCGSGAARSEHV